MNVACVIASGASLMDSDIELIYQGRLRGEIQSVIAVSDVGLYKTPWADALVSHDSCWWIANPASFQFKGKKYSARGVARTIKFDVKSVGAFVAINSGLMAMYVAREKFKAQKIILLGFDMHRRNGQHFFGKHKSLFNGRPLSNTDEKKFSMHLKQFNSFTGCDVINCTPDSDLKKFPMLDLNEALNGLHSQNTGLAGTREDIQKPSEIVAE